MALCVQKISEAKTRQKLHSLIEMIMIPEMAEHERKKYLLFFAYKSKETTEVTYVTSVARQDCGTHNEKSPLGIE